MKYTIKVKPVNELIATIKADSYNEAVDKLFKALKTKIQIEDETVYLEDSDEQPPFYGGNDMFDQLKKIMGI